MIIDTTFLKPVAYIANSTPERRRDLAKLIGKQILGIALAFPTAGMSIAINCISYDNYERKHHPEGITWLDDD